VYDQTRVHALRELPITAEEKGFGGPLHREPVTPATLARLRPPAREGWLGSPRALLRQSALQHNIATMARYCSELAVDLYPHAKTTMAPQVVTAQLEAGARGITVATVAQARLFRRFGVRHILVANEVTDEASITWLGRELADDPEFTPTCYVDSVAGVALLDRTLSDLGSARPLNVVVELGHALGRTGARTLSAARDVAEAVARTPRLALVGVAGYEGSIVAADHEATLAAARAFCEQLGTLTSELLTSGHLGGVPVITAGGSAYFDAVVDTLAGEPAWQVVLRSGCYVTHDHGLYRSISAFERATAAPRLHPALEVWAPVLSRPERGTVVIGAGRRDVSSDSGLPVLLRGHGRSGPVDVRGAVADRLFDQHLVVTVPDGCTLSAGDEVALGISHPCTTFDKWRWIPVVDDRELVVDVVRTFF
jgi:D-serine deaminase-like pyridoxal phosphate-dependent protein